MRVDQRGRPEMRRPRIVLAVIRKRQVAVNADRAEMIRARSARCAHIIAKLGNRNQAPARAT